MKKIKSKQGFSLAEMLLAVLILLLVSVIVATGVPVAKDAYEKVVIAANAQTLLSTTVAALRDELGTAREISEETIDGVKYLSYYSADTRARSRLFIAPEKEDATNPNNTIWIQEYVEDSSLAGLGIAAPGEAARPLVTSATASSNVMYVTFDIDNTTINYDDNTVTVEGLAVYSKLPGNAVIADMGRNTNGELNKLTIKTYSSRKVSSQSGADSEGEMP